MGKILKDKKNALIWLLSIFFVIFIVLYVIFYLAQSPAAKFEQQSAKKIKNVLETVVGKENVKVEVSAYYDLNNSQTVIENYQNAQNGFVKEIRKIYSRPGEIKRMSVGIVVNKILTPSQTREIEQLVSSTVGIDTSRGDKVTVSSFKFSTASEKSFNNFLLVPFLAIVFVTGGILLYFFKKTSPAQETYKNEPMELDFSGIADEPQENLDVITKPEISRNLKGELKETISKDPKEAARLLNLFLKERI